MSREIKFRGIEVESGKWVYGSYYYAEKSKQHFIVTEKYEGSPQFKRVIPKTVGQYIDLKDKDGNEIYGGDYVEWENGYFGSVVWNEDCAMFLVASGRDVWGQAPDLIDWNNCTITGNIYE